MRLNFEQWFQSTHPEIPIQSAASVITLAAGGATVPFIARYRKEQTGGIDEVAIQKILDSKERWDLIVKRQEFIVQEIERQQKLTPELKEKILSTYQMELLDDIFLPYKQKRKTKATLAKEAGLEPLAQWIWNCGHGTEAPLPGQTLEIWAFTFRNEAKNINDAATAIQGAQDILVEKISEVQELRQLVRTEFFEKGIVRTEKGKKPKPNSKFENYFDYKEPIKSLLQPANSHRYLAIRRGWMEEELSLSVQGPVDDLEFENRLIQAFEYYACPIKSFAELTDVLHRAARLAYKAYVFTSIENEIHKTLREVADEAAIHVFADNVKKLLLAAPFGARSVLGIDPGIRTGCKLAVVNSSGKYVASTVMHLNSEASKEKAKPLIVEIVRTGEISAVAVGNGTGGRETEAFVRSALREAGLETPVVMVSEAGASVYSASEAAREEFPDLDLTVRGAISIARRLQDPLAELVKVEPKSIGVGQYQHDVSAHALKRNLGFVVESCVNQVGVNLNTASYHLLSYVSGIGPTLAKSLVEYRSHHGLFKERQDLLKVDHFTKKTFEQAAGFLRIPESSNPLDNTGVHPENYPKIESFALRIGKSIKDLTGRGVELIKKDTSFKEQVGPFTFEDIVKELEKPGRDPREEFSHFEFRHDIHEVKDLKPSMLCPGIVTNVTNFGAFVDIGVHQDGLVHISQLSDKFIKDPKEVISPGDRVNVRVLEVNIEKSQISLSLKNTTPTQAAAVAPKARLAPSGGLAIKPLSSPHKPPQRAHEPDHKKRKPKEAFNNPFGSLASLRNTLKPK